MKREAEARATQLADKLDTAEAKGPRHSYGLRDVGEGLYVVVRVEGTREEVLTRPERRGYALGAMVDRIEDDPWGA